MTVLFKGIYAPAAYAQVYVNTKSVNVVIDSAKAFNNDTTDRTLTANIVPQGSVVDPSNTVMSIKVTAGQTWLCADLIGEELEPGDSIWMLAEVASMIAIHGSGRPRPAE